jgi:hypothetical protein
VTITEEVARHKDLRTAGDGVAFPMAQPQQTRQKTAKTADTPAYRRPEIFSQNLQ